MERLLELYDRKCVKKKVLNWRKKLENAVEHDKYITITGATK